MEPSCVSYYYPDHLPDLGRLAFPLPGAQCSVTVSGVQHAGAPVSEDEVIQSGDISSGDYVKVELDP